MKAVPAIRLPSESTTPTPIPPRMENALRCAVNSLKPPMEPGRTTYTIAACDALSEPARVALTNRTALIDLWMQPAGADHATECYKDLIASLTPPRVDAETEVRELKQWIEATAPLPLFALKGACDAYRDGLIGNREWMPRPAQVCHEARRRMEALSKERREIRAVLSAEIEAPTIDATRKAELIAIARAFTAGTRAEAETQRRGRMTPQEIADAQAVAEMMRTGRDPRPMPMLSRELRAKYGLPEPQEREMVPDVPERDYGTA